MEPKIAEIAQRIKALREIINLTPEEMAQATGINVTDYLILEEGNSDFSFTFLYKCAEKFGVDMIEILTGENPHLTEYAIIRGEKGLPIKRRAGFEYYHLASTFKGKAAEPFLVKAPFKIEEQNNLVSLSTHEGQEFDYILEGSLKFVYEEHAEELQAGDSVYYNSGKGHGMIATSADGCKFLALVLKNRG